MGISLGTMRRISLYFTTISSLRRLFFGRISHKGRLMLACLIVFAITCGIQQYYLKIGHGYSLPMDVIIVHTDDDLCSRWISIFPQHAILLVGHLQTSKSRKNCYYVTRQTGFIEHLSFALKFSPRRIHVVDGRLNPEFCLQESQELGHSNRTTGILYENHEHRIYDSTRHWGYGGSQKPGQNYACEDLKSPIITATVPSTWSPTCSQVYPPITIAPQLYALTTKSCITLQSPAFWALPFFENYGDSAQDGVLLSFIAQKLLWLSGNVLRMRTLCTDTTDGTYTSELKEHAQNIIGNLDQYTCKNKHLGTCFMMMANDTLREKNLSLLELAELIKWVTDFQEDMPPSQNRSEQSSTHYSNRGSPIAEDVYGKDNRSTHCALVGASKMKDYIRMNTAGRICLLSETCKQSSPPAELQTSWIQWNNILLIVVFNTPKYKSLPYYEVLYRPFFPKIIYCGPTFPNGSEAIFNKFSFQFITFGETPTWLNAGSLHYKCLIEASKLGYDVHGYLQAADDVILMPHRLQHFNPSKVWSFRLDNMIRMEYESLTFCDGPSCREENVTFWHTFQNSTLDALNEIKELAESSTVLGRCATNIRSLFGGPTWSLRILSDIIYVPTRLIQEVTEVLNVFLRNQVYLEIAIPTAIHCVTPQSEIEPLYTHFHNVDRVGNETNLLYTPDDYEPADPSAVLMSHRLYSGGRDKPWKHFTPELMTGATFYHPYKMGYMALNHYYGMFFCELASFLGDPRGNMSVFKMRNMNCSEAAC